MKRYVSMLLAVLQVSAIPAVAQTQPAPAALTGEKLASYAKARASLKEAAEHGDAASQYALGVTYELPLDGTPPNRKGAAYWYQQASNQGNVRGSFRLGLYYYDIGDDYTARSAFEKAANAGFPPGMYRLGEMMLRRNYAGEWNTGVAWLYKASNAGDPDAQDLLGWMDWELYLHPDRLRGPGNPVSWFMKAADGGSCQGMLDLGGTYFNGVGVPQNAALADQAFQRAQSCPGASDLILSTAAHFRALIAAHHLPDPNSSKPDPIPQPKRVEHSQSRDTALLVGLFAAVGGAVFLGSLKNDPSHTPIVDPDDRRRQQEDERYQNQITGYFLCKRGSDYTAMVLYDYHC